MTASCWELGWPEHEFSRALLGAARALGMPTKQVELTLASGPLSGDSEPLDRWLVDSARRCGLELQPCRCSHSELNRVLCHVGPSLLRITSGETRRFLVVLRATRRKLTLLTPSLEAARVPRAAIVEQLTRADVAQAAGPVSTWLSALQVSKRRVRRAEAKLRELVLGQRWVDGIYLLRPDPGMPFAAQLREQGLLRRAAWTLGLATAHVAVNLCGWMILGRGALGGLMDRDWVAAWVLLQISAAPLHLGVFWLGGTIMHELATSLKQRLLCGALRIDPDEIRTRGSGRLLAMVFESSALESAGLTGSFALLLSMLQLVSTACVITWGAGGVSQLVILLGWCAFVAYLAVRYFNAQKSWTEERLGLARGFVENVVGNRTRIAQQPSARWHLAEDRQLEAHVDTATAMDDAQTLLSNLPARGWLLVSFLGLMPVLLTSDTTPAALAIALGSILQVYASLGVASIGAVTVGGALVAWTQIATLFRAAARTDSDGKGCFGCAPPAQSSPQPRGNAESPVVLDLQGVSFRYQPLQPPVLSGCELRLRRGDRVLLEGCSGSGKSTLAALMVGMRKPDSGHILSGGLDLATLGSVGWRRRAASAPQFHENHILSGPLAFNLLMGRAWPASNADLAEAEEVCRALELGTLLDRMPSGLQQIVGETGWQLSHGERSRIFLGRALLQKTELLVLDESFGALDAATLRRCLDVVLARASTLVLIAHP